MKNLVICGDSFSIGIGCHNLNTEPYGSLLAKELGLNLINLAKGSSTNLSISLQVKHAVEHIDDIELLIVGNTCYHRTEWFPEDASENREVNNLNVNYHQYPPFGEGTYQYVIENPMKQYPNYKGELLTENWYGVIDYVDNLRLGFGADISIFVYMNAREGIEIGRNVEIGQHTSLLSWSSIGDKKGRIVIGDDVPVAVTECGLEVTV
jgi:hypothetical protein